MTSPIEEQARDRFESSIGTLEDAVAKKAALADPTRYALLCYVHDVEEQTMEDLSDIVDDDVEEHVSELIDAGLLARTGAPDEQPGKTVVRATHAGRREIETDIEPNRQRRE